MSKLLFISHSLNNTGAPLVLMDMVLVCLEQGNTVDVVGMEDGPLNGEYQKLGVKLEIADDFLDNLALWQEKFAKYDAVVVNTLAAIEAVYALNTTNVPTIWWIHEHEYWFVYYQSIFPKKEELRNNIHIYGVSPITNNFIRKYCGYEAGLLPLVVKDVAEGFNAGNATKDKVTFVLPATYSNIKGQDILLEAVERLPEDIRTRCTFALFGRKNDGELDYYNSLKDSVSGIPEIELLDVIPHDEAMRRVSEADYLLATSRLEPFPTTAVEAMMLGTVPIISDACGVLHFLEGGKDCLAFKSENADDLKNALILAVKLRCDFAEEYNKIRDNARKKYEICFSLEVFSNNAQAILDRILPKEPTKNILFLDWYNNGPDFLDQYFVESKVVLSEIFTRNGEGIDASQIPYYEGWDYVVASYVEADFSEILSYLCGLGVPRDRIIMIASNGIWADSYAGIRELFKPKWQHVLDTLIDMDNFSARAMGEYATVTAEDMTFLNNSNDECILYHLYSKKEIWAKDDMLKFHDMAVSRFSFRQEQDIFCDIGANIGTTSLYFKKKIDSDVKILAFEPSKENFKLYRANAILNDIADEDYTIANYGLSDQTCEVSFAYNPKNPGASRVSSDEERVTETVKMITLDEYVEKNNVDVQRIKYIWVDVEGHEPAFIRGAKETLKKINVPIVMEFSAELYKENGEFERYISDLSEIYDYFIISQDEEKTEYPIGGLSELVNQTYQYDIFFFKRY